MSGSNIDNVISCAVNYASDNHHEYVTLEHLTLCLLEDDNITNVLDEIDCDWETALSDLENYLQDEEFNGLKGENPFDGRPKKTVSIERVLQRAFAQVIFSSRESVNPMDLLVSILSEDNTHARYLLELNGVSRLKLIEYLTKHQSTSDAMKDAEEFLINLNEKASQSEIDPLIGRMEEVDDLVHILARRKKNNPLLIGEPGTGKTAIAIDTIINQNNPISIMEIVPKIYTELDPKYFGIAALQLTCHLQWLTKVGIVKESGSGKYIPLEPKILPMIIHDRGWQR